MKRAIDWFIGIVCIAGACLVMQAQDGTLREKSAGPTGRYDLGSTNWVVMRGVTQDIPAHPLNLPYKLATLCGTEYSHPYADLIHVGCVDYEELRRVAPSIPWPQGSSTQVLIHAKRGDVVAVTVDGETKYWPLTIDAWGRLVALVPFDGKEHSALSIKIGSWLE